MRRAASGVSSVSESAASNTVSVVSYRLRFCECFANGGVLLFYVLESGRRCSGCHVDVDEAVTIRPAFVGWMCYARRL
jgi:hypothetical protein